MVLLIRLRLSSFRVDECEYALSASTLKRPAGPVREADAAVELGVAGESPFESGHADEDQSEVVAVEVVAKLFQSLLFEEVGFVDL